jgi:hypothetical protein
LEQSDLPYCLSSLPASTGLLCLLTLVKLCVCDVLLWTVFVRHLLYDCNIYCMIVESYCMTLTVHVDDIARKSVIGVNLHGEVKVVCTCLLNTEVNPMICSYFDT